MTPSPRVASLRSPLTRQPFGGARYRMRAEALWKPLASTLLSLSPTACPTAPRPTAGNAEPTRSGPIEYVVVRSVTEAPDADHKIRVPVETYGDDGLTTIDGYATEHDLLDTRHYDLANVRLKRSVSFMVIVPLTDVGRQVLGDWTSHHVGERLGIYVDGKLVAAPMIHFEVSESFAITWQFSEDEAEQIAERLRQARR